MKSPVMLAVACLVCSAVSAHAQLGGLGDRLKQAQDAKSKVDQKVGQIRISEADERKLGEEVSAKLRQEFGVYQDKDVTR
jgi:predicted Zn-dependent protease